MLWTRAWGSDPCRIPTHLVAGAGQFPADGDLTAAAALLASAPDGLQLQWLYEHTVDVEGSLAYLLTALGVPPEMVAAAE